MHQRIAIVVGIVFALGLVVGCAAPSGGRVIGGQPIAISELPEYPGATELGAGTSVVIDPLFRAAQQEPPPFIGLGIEVEKTERVFQLPADTTFVQVKAFYTDKLQSSGWRQDGVMRVISEKANALNPTLQSGTWIRVDQTLVIALASDSQSGRRELLLSLATH